MYKHKYQEGDQFGGWRLLEFINAGGNGEVWQATHDDRPSEVYAIKLLKKIDFVSYTRFRDEVKILKENGDIKGLLQIIDYGLPKKPKEVTPCHWQRL